MDLPVWAKELPLELINKIADDHHIDPNLVAAIVQTESSGIAYATRYEPNYRWTVDIKLHARQVRTTFETETVHQKTSWGLMQIMGGTARWMGFEGHLPELCKPEVGLRWGCAYLERLLRGPHSALESISCYNAGSVRYKDGKLSNQEYVDRVTYFQNQLEMKKPA